MPSSRECRERMRSILVVRRQFIARSRPSGARGSEALRIGCAGFFLKTDASSAITRALRRATSICRLCTSSCRRMPRMEVVGRLRLPTLSGTIKARWHEWLRGCSQTRRLALAPSATEIVACPGCDLLQRVPPLSSNTRARRQRCGEPLGTSSSDSRERPLALAVAAAMWLQGGV